MRTTPQPSGDPVSIPPWLDQRGGALLDQSGSATVEAVRQWVADHRDEVLAELAAWVAVRSVSSSGEGFLEATDAAREMLARNGFDARIVPTDGHPGVIGELSGGDPDAPHVLVYGHYDVQATGPRELWSSDPWETEIRDGRIFGRGTADNKGQHLAQILAVRALREVGSPSPCRLTLVLDGEEEIASPHLPAVLATITDRPDMSLWSDGPVHVSGRWTVSLGVRGIVIFTLTARGATSGPLHSGHWGGVAPNPDWRLVQLLATMRSPDGVSLVEGLEDGVLPLTTAEQDALAALPLDLPAALASAGITDLEPPAALTYYQRLTRPTFSINSLTCHDTQDHRTIIPDTATARCDIRMVGGQRSAHVVEALRAHVQRYAPDIEFEAAVDLTSAGRDEHPAHHTINLARNTVERALRTLIDAAVDADGNHQHERVRACAAACRAASDFNTGGLRIPGKRRSAVLSGVVLHAAGQAREPEHHQHRRMDERPRVGRRQEPRDRPGDVGADAHRLHPHRVRPGHRDPQRRGPKH